MNEKEKTTVPVPSVGADGEQSLSYVTEEIVTQEPDYFNFDDGKHGDEYLEQMLRMSEPSYLPTMTMNQIYETVYESRRPIIENLLYPGAYLFVGAPKVGKSFFMAQLAYHVSVGLPLWDYKTHPGTVLYLALEDDYRRIQERLYRMFGVDGTDNLHFATFAKSLATGLFEQLKRFVKEHPGTNLIIIDTLQKIREVNNDRYSYANDYEIIGQLKALIQSHIEILSLTDSAPFSPYEFLYCLNSDEVQEQVRSLIFIQSTLGTLGNRIQEINIKLPVRNSEWKEKIHAFQHIFTVVTSGFEVNQPAEVAL